MFVSGKFETCGGQPDEPCGGALKVVWESWDEQDRIFVGEQVCTVCGQSWLYSRQATAEDGAEKMAKKKASLKNEYVNRKAKKKGKTPRSQVLPGMEQVRNRNLDRLCESIGEAREQLGVLRGEEKTDIGRALREMHDKDVVVYRHAGVELVRIPGEETIRVRTTKEKASDVTPSEGADEAPDAGGDVAEAQETAGE
jgi:hypothetical protein